MKRTLTENGKRTLHNNTSQYISCDALDFYTLQIASNEDGLIDT